MVMPLGVFRDETDFLVATVVIIQLDVIAKNANLFISIGPGDAPPPKMPMNAKVSFMPFTLHF
jgi:hypothetical protein